HNHQGDNDKVESDRRYPTAGTEEQARERCHDDHEYRDKAHLPGLREPLTREHDQAHGALIDVDGGLGDECHRVQDDGDVADPFGEVDRLAYCLRLLKRGKNANTTRSLKVCETGRTSMVGGLLGEVGFSP